MKFRSWFKWFSVPGAIAGAIAAVLNEQTPADWYIANQDCKSIAESWADPAGKPLAHTPEQLVALVNGYNADHPDHHNTDWVDNTAYWTARAKADPAVMRVINMEEGKNMVLFKNRDRCWAWKKRDTP